MFALSGQFDRDNRGRLFLYSGLLGADCGGWAVWNLVVECFHHEEKLELSPGSALYAHSPVLGLRAGRIPDWLGDW